MTAARSVKKPVWVPRDTERTNTAKFISYVNQKHGLGLKSFDELHSWSTSPRTFQDFWCDAYEYLELSPVRTTGSGPMVDSKSTDVLNLFPPPRLFTSAFLNLAEILLRDGPDEEIAIHFVREGVDGVEEVTWKALRERTRRARDSLVNSGVQSGDVVAAVISNSVDAIVLCLASLSLGAVWSSSAPDLGVSAIVDRYRQVNPKVIFADDGYVYAGKPVNLGSRIAEWSQKLRQSCKGLRDVVVIPYNKAEFDLASIAHGCKFEDFLSRDSGRKLEFAMHPFQHPGFILFSSGTTGPPKCIIHSAGGVALKVKTDMILQHDIRKTDVVFQFTTASWVMWVLNFVNLASGSSMLLYDGSPFFPRATILLELAQDLGVSVFGTSPKYLSEIRRNGIIPRKQFELSKLRVMTSTGATLATELYHWFYSTAFPPEAHLISMSGGTDIAGCFVGGTPLLPVYAGEIQAKSLGMAVDIMDSARVEPVSVEASGSAGELTCCLPFPSQPLGFHGPEGVGKYKASYFERFGPQVWCQGDFVQREQDTGGYLMLGRSDGVLNPSGVRFGSSEIYAVTETIPAIVDSICVGQRRPSDLDERVLLFVKLEPGHTLTEALINEVKTAIRQRYSPKHVPKFIFQVSDIPYTTNGKKCEINVKQIVSRLKTAVSGTVANPHSLKLYEPYSDLPADTEPVDSKFQKSLL